MSIILTNKGNKTGIKGKIVYLGACFAGICTNVAGVPDWGGEAEVITRISGYLTFAAVASGLVAVGLIVYGGFQYITSEGDADKAKGGSDTIKNALIGLAIIILSRIIIEFVIQTVTKASIVP